LLRYTPTQEYRAHHDWFQPEDPQLEDPGNRDTSIFVYLKANCTGGTTAFPKVPRPRAPEWCDVLKCEDENGQEVQWVEVKPRIGAAVFWYNLNEWGETEDKTLHAGTPIIEGLKIGLNIWTRQRKFR
jgi:prolyl 4-hydroxylase